MQMQMQRNNCKMMSVEEGNVIHSVHRVSLRHAFTYLLITSYSTCTVPAPAALRTCISSVRFRRCAMHGSGLTVRGIHAPAPMPTVTVSQSPVTPRMRAIGCSSGDGAVCTATYR